MTIMAIGEILLREVPETLLAGVQTGEFRIYGSIIRSVQTGRIAGHLQETSGLTSLASQLLTSPATLPLQGVGLGVDLLGHAANYVQNEQIKTAIGVLHNLQLGNAALDAAGIGVSIAGFAVLSAKIDRVETKLDSLSQRVDAIGRAVEHMLREKIADDFIRLRTATEQMDEGWHLSDASQHWRHVANEAHALVNIFERRIYQMLDDDRSDTQAVEPMQEAMAMAIAMRVSARLAAGDDVAARYAAGEGAKALAKLGGRFGVADNALKRMQASSIEVGTSAWGEALERTTDELRPLFNTIRSRETSAISTILTLEELERQGIEGRRWLETARNEETSPILCLLPTK